MQEAFFEYLANKGWASADSAELPKTIFRMSRAQIETAIDEIEELIPDPQGKVTSPFEFLASGALSGGPAPCAALECRSDRLRELAYFTALYADKVWFPSPFAGLKGLDEMRLRLEFTFNIFELQQLQPLFAAHLMELTPSHNRDNLCSHCYANFISQTRGDFKERFQRLTQELDDRYEREVKFSVEKDGRDVALLAQGPAQLVDEHFGAYIFPAPPKPIRAMANRAKGKPAPLSLNMVRKHAIPRKVYEEILKDILSQNYYSSTYGTGYLTQRTIDFELVNALAPQPMRNANALLNA